MWTIQPNPRMVMSEPRYLNTVTVAQALGVSVTTVKRWVDDGVLPAHKTPGGHRKILLGDVLRLVHSAGLPRVDLALLTGTTAGAATDLDVVGEQLYCALERGDQEVVRALLLAAYEAGMPIEELGDRVVSPVMARVGGCWADGRWDVYQEHRATLLVLRGLYAVRARLAPHAGDGRPLALGGCPEGDYYLLANLLTEMTLLNLGWDVVNIGPNTPLASFGRAMRAVRPRLVWISCSHLADAEKFQAEYAAFYREAEQAGVAVALGGRAFTECVRACIPYTTFGDGLAHLTAFVRALHPLPCPPRRGRPAR